MPIPVIDNVRLPLDIEAGALMGPTFSTGVVPLSSGAEQRQVNWDQERFKANVAYGVMRKDNPEDIEDGWRRIVEFFRARRGRARGFLFRDWTDYEAVNEALYRVPGDDYVTLQLAKRYDNYVRRVTRPSAQTIALTFAFNPYPQAGGNVGGTVLPAWNYDGKGLIRFEGDGIGQVNAGLLKATFEYDIPVRFDSDELQVSMLYSEAGSIPNIDILQVIE